MARGTVTAGRTTYRAARKATDAQGADKTGLSRLIETQALHNAGDVTVAVSLAGTLFFQVPAGQARGQVALFLLLTLLPFSIIAPFVGPFLDRFRHGRRWAIGAMLAFRAVLCLALADSMGSGASWWQFPAALGILVASRGYNVARAAATPRLLPDGMSLVKANGRISLAGVVSGAVVAPLAIAGSRFGPEWSLRLAFVIFVCATVLAIRLPAKVDSDRGETQVPIGQLAGAGRQWWAVPPVVVTALRANFGLRVLSGFLTIFLAFLLRNNPPAGWEDRFTILLGLGVAAAGVGSALGTLVGSMLKDASPLRLVKACLAVDAAVVVVAAISFTVVTMVLLALVAGLCQMLGKFALDATIQDQVPEHSRTSVFGRSETMIQLAWVLGGGLGVVLPTIPALGFWVVTVVLGCWLVFVLKGTSVSELGAAPARWIRSLRS